MGREALEIVLAGMDAFSGSITTVGYGFRRSRLPDWLGT
jgi:hypothetical protein